MRVPPRKSAVPVLATVLAALASLLVATAPAAQADGPGSGAPWLVSVGDSYISGEAGRWAGSSNTSSSYADALGATAYFDNAGGTGEQINRCHRSKAAEIYVGGGVNGLNLACSGAKTSTYTTSEGYFKPGLDFADDGAGHLGPGQAAAAVRGHPQREDGGGLDRRQRLQLRVDRAAVRDRLPGVAALVQGLLQRRLVGHRELHHPPTSRRSAAGSRRRTPTSGRRCGTRATPTRPGRCSCRTTRRRCPPGPASATRQSGYTRQSTGGCGFWNADADWANATALPTINNTVTGAVGTAGITNARTLDLSSAFNGRRLCESTVGLYEEKGLTSWTQAGAVDRTEWVNQIRTVSTWGSSPYYVQESLHPNYWAQLATRSCVRQAWNAGTPRGGTCSISGTGLVNGEPRMTLK